MITIQNNTAKPITQVMVRNIASEVLTYDQKHYKGNKNKTRQLNKLLQINKSWHMSSKVTKVIF